MGGGGGNYSLEFWKWGFGGEFNQDVYFSISQENDLLCINRKLVSWCFKPSQPQRITSGLDINRNTNS